MGRFEMVFGLSGAQPVAAGRRGCRQTTAVALPLDAVAPLRPAARRLFVRLGAPATTATTAGEVILPVILGVPLAALALTSLGGSFVAETPMQILATDRRGFRADLPASHLTVILRAMPGAGTFARFQIVVRVRDVAQTLRFSVLHTGSGLSTWGEAAYAPAGALAASLVAH